MSALDADLARTTAAYNHGAALLAKKFAKLERTKDIAWAFDFVQKREPKVLELGCGDGRDAEEILKRTSQYLGVDISENMIALAKARGLHGNFTVGDMRSITLPKDQDIVFAFASWLHLDKEAVRDMCRKVAEHLGERGLLYVSLKRAPYHRELKFDESGERVFYFYEMADLRELAAPWFEVVFEEAQEILGVPWFVMALVKRGV